VHVPTSTATTTTPTTVSGVTNTKAKSFKGKILGNGQGKFELN